MDVLIFNVIKSEAKCEGRAALFAAIFPDLLKSEAKSEGGAALFAAIMHFTFDFLPLTAFPDTGNRSFVTMRPQRRWSA